MSHGNARVVLLLAGAVVGIGLLALLLTGGLGGPDPVDPTPTGPGAGGDSGPAPATRGAPGGVSGTVLVFGTNEPAAGIPVRIEGGAEPIELETARDGMFVSSIPSGRDLTIRIVAGETYAPIVIPGIRVNADETESLGTLYLTPSFLVRGEVVDGAGKGVPGAQVRALRPTRWKMGTNLFEWVSTLAKPRVPLDEAVTGADGSFTLLELTPGTYRLEAEAEGFAVGAIGEAIVSPESEGHRFRIVLAPGVGLSGTVKSAGGDGIEGATVTTLRTKQAFQDEFDFQPVQVLTGAAGAFEFPMMAPGEVALMVRAEGYPIRIVDSLELGRQETVEIEMGGTAVMEGTVTGPEGEPVVGARISLALDGAGPTLGLASTDRKGLYRIENLSPGRIQFLFVEAEGYANWPTDMSVLMGARGEGFGKLEDGQTLVKDVELVSGATIRGVVTDRITGRPIPGARIRLLNSSLGFGGLGGTKAALADSEGRYRLEGVPVGRQMLLASADGYFQPDIDPGTLFAGGGSAEADPDQPILMVGADDTEIEKNLKLEAGATIAGTVLDPAGDPVAGAKVSLGGSQDEMGMLRRMLDLGSPTVLTDRDGNFRLSGAASGENVVVKAEREGLVPGASRPIRVETGRVVEGITIRLRQGGAILGAVYGSDGAPLSGATVRTAEEPQGEGNDWQLNWQLQQAGPTLVDAEGRFRVEGLAPGRRVVKIEGPGHLPAIRRNVEILEGGEMDLGAIRLEAGLAIEGNVVDEKGAPIAGAHVFVNPMDASAGPLTQINDNDARTDDQGRFRIAALPPGRYHLSVNADQYAAPQPREVSAGETGLRIMLEKGLDIEGRVTLPDGRPAAGIGVNAEDETGSSRGVQTDEEGRFSIRGLASGTYTVTAASTNRFGFDPDAPSVQPARIEGVAAGTAELLIRLEPGLTISGVVVDEDGNPVANTMVGARLREGEHLGPQSGFGRTGPDGTFRIGGLAAAEYQLQAWGENGQGQADVVRAGSTGVRIVVKAPQRAPDEARPR